MGSDSAFARIITDMAMAEPSLKTHDKHTNNRMWYKPRGQQLKTIGAAHTRGRELCGHYPLGAGGKPQRPQTQYDQ